MLALALLPTTDTLHSQEDTFNYPGLIHGVAYEDDPSTYTIRVIFNFIDGNATSPSQAWWSTPENGDYVLADEAKAGMANLNHAFNSHGIFFVPFGQGHCDEEGYYHSFIRTDFDEDPDLFGDLDGERANLQPANEIAQALNIYVLTDQGAIAGHAYSIPSNYLHVQGNEPPFGLATRSPLLIHEVGHALGLLHTHAGTDNQPPECDPYSNSPNIPPGCSSTLNLCCGDFVEETPPNNQTILNAPAGCENETDPDDETLIRNYMSYVDERVCQDQFVEEQVRRMKMYLREWGDDSGSSELYDIQYRTVYPGAVPAGVTGDVIVESGVLSLNAPLEMLPEASITVKAGATLRVLTKLTSACGGIWDGIKVENGGRVFLLGNEGVIEHARCGIEVLGGGNAQIWGGSIVNCVQGLRMRPGENPLSPEGKIVLGKFWVDDFYRGGAASPVLLSLGQTEYIEILLSDFLDQRAPCESIDCPLRAVGIKAEDSGFRSGGNYFHLLEKGIDAGNLTLGHGAPLIEECKFQDNFTGVQILNSSFFEIRDNLFELTTDLNDYTPFQGYKVTGVSVLGLSEALSVRYNRFEQSSLDSENQLFISEGTYCEGTGEGLGNQVSYNEYSGMLIGNAARNNNGSMENGLVYLCNDHDPEAQLSPGPSSPLEVADYKIEGTVKNPHYGVAGNNDIAPSGNIFSQIGPSILYESSGDNLEYYYDGNLPQHIPQLSEGIFPISEEGFDFSDYCATESCTPPCEQPQDDPVFRFYDQKSKRDSLKEALSSLSGAAATETQLKLHAARWAMDEAAGAALKGYVQDTIAVALDSVYQWLGRANTYGTAYLLAREHFLKGDLAAFEKIWAAIPEQFLLNEVQIDEYEGLSQVFNSLKGPVMEGGNLDKLPNAAIESLQLLTPHCNEAGLLAAHLLHRNGVEAAANCAGNAAPSLSSKSGSPQSASESRGKFKRSHTQPLRIYPNPSDGTINVHLPQGVPGGQLQVFSLQGQQLYTQNLAGKISRVKLSLPAGIYLVAVAPASGTAPLRQKVVLR
ncbi:MAG: zinc-dependent metalloprotease [Phaeodactylibacter sp.]|uniref:zinc-dependent metalloprotease n=1 Tax=Phaeodactylibacter sp. TaxID=1940289 RepID=UPI0032EBFE36